MAQLAALIVTTDEEFHREVARLLRAGGVPVGLVDNRKPGVEAAPDVAVVDIRGEASSGMGTIERLRAGWSTIAIFAVASTVGPDVILQAMRAGANEFFTWPSSPGDAPAVRAMEASFREAVRRAAARRDAAQGGARQASVTVAFFGAKGGAGTTTLSANSAVELARLTKRATIIVDLKPGLGEVALFLGVRPRFTVLDAIENLHRLDRDFLRELVTKHKSGVDILAGSDQFDRPNAQDAGSLEEVLRVLARIYDFVVVDVGNLMSAWGAAALFAADTIFLVANPDVPSIRNAQRLVERIRQLGAGSERIRILLNRVSEEHLIAPKQIETALGHPIHHTFSSDYGTVSTALNSGVPLTLTNNSELAGQFGRFARRIVGSPEEATEPEASRRAPFLGLF